MVAKYKHIVNGFAAITVLLSCWPTKTIAKPGPRPLPTAFHSYLWKVPNCESQLASQIILEIFDGESGRIPKLAEFYKVPARKLPEIFERHSRTRKILTDLIAHVQTSVPIAELTPQEEKAYERLIEFNQWFMMGANSSRRRGR